MSIAATSAEEPGAAGELNPRITDWTLRPFQAFPFSPALLGLVLGLGYTLVSQLGRYAVSDETGSLLASITMDALNGAIFGYVPTVLFYLRRGILRDLSELHGAIGCSRAELEAIAVDITCVPPRHLLFAGLIGAGLFSLMPFLDPTFFGDEAAPALGTPGMTFFMLRSSLTGWLVGHIFATESRAAGGYARLGSRRIRVDLLDTSSLYPFTRRGLRSAFAWIASASMVSLFWLTPGAGSSNGPIMLLIGLTVVTSFFRSISGVRGSIRREKRAQLNQLRDEIREERRALLGENADSSGNDARLAGLIAYHDLIERVREWPFDAPVILRLALLALLGLGSWLGGALVERLIESAGF